MSVNPELLKERQNATFKTEELTYFLDGSKEETENRKRIEQLALDDPVFDYKPFCFLNRDEKYDLAVKIATHIREKMEEHGLLDLTKEAFWYKRIAAHRQNLPVGLHSLMFTPTIASMGTEEQKDKWLDKAMNYEIIGTYAQTEMGHGTFLRGLETTATYDPKLQEFVLHSPTLTSTKFWPGNLGKTANHVVVVAQLYTQGVCHGVHVFILQIRDLHTHKPMPGVTLGDIGPKFGYNTNDNGFMKLDRVRIPRENMLMKHAQVLPDGTYQKRKSTHSKQMYDTMMLVRALLAGDSAIALAEASTIAIRYSAIRYQSEIVPGKEVKILDFQTQQYKLIPLLATSYAFYFIGSYSRELYFLPQEDMEKGELHALTAGLKAFTTWEAMSGIEVCRSACGGHGYSMASGFPTIYTDFCPNVTLEGENTVMLLQTARYLMKCQKLASGGMKTPKSLMYLTSSQLPSQLNSNMDLSDLLQAYKHRAQWYIMTAAKKLNDLTSTGVQAEVAWNETSILLVKTAMAHVHLLIVQNFIDTISGDLETSMKKVLHDLCRMYALHGIVEKSGEFLESGALTSSQVTLSRDLVNHLLSIIRPNCVALVDAYDIHDRSLHSVLGRYDGQVYEHLYKWVQNSNLNKSEVHDSFYKYLKPMMQGSRKSKL